MPGDATGRGRSKKREATASAPVARESHASAVYPEPGPDALLQTLREREDQLSFVIEAADLGTWDWDLRSNTLVWSSRCCELFGLPPDTVLSYEAFLLAIHPEDRERVDRAVQETISEHRDYDEEMRTVWPDGTLHWVSSRGRAYYDAGGQPIRMAGVALDITERKLADSRVRRFFETDLLALLYWQIDGTVLDANNQYLEITGYSREDLRAGRLNWARITPPEFQDADDDARRQIRETGVHRPYEKQYIRKDGKRVWVLVSAAAWEDNRNEGVSFILDITKRKLAEEALLASEAQFRNLANAIPQLCWMANADGWIFWYNQRWYEYTGTTPEQMEGWGWQSVHDPNMLPEVLERWKQSISSAQLFDMIFPLRGADGVFRPFLTRIVPVKDGNGRLVRWFGTNTDVTELRDAQEALRVSEEKFSKAFSGNPAAIAVTRLVDGVFIEVNDTWTQLTGYSREEVSGVPALTLGLWADPLQRQAFVSQLHEKGALRGWQPEFKKKSGESFFAELSAQILTIGGEEVALSTLVDITERQRAEEELRLSNERFQVALKNSSVVVFNQDLDLRYTWIYNPALGYEMSEVLGKRDADLFRGAETTEAIKREVMRTGVAQRREVSLHWQNSDRYYDLQVDPLRDSAGEIAGVTCAAIDITDRKRAEAAMLRSEKLASVGRMAATVAHEINNPLEAVMNSIFLAQMEKSPDAIRSHLKIADEELRRVAHIARQSLGFYRDRTDPVSTTLTIVLDSAIDLLKNKIRAKNAAVRKKFGEGMRVHAVANELRQVFGNLIANSLDAIESGGVITVATKRYTRPDGQRWVRITVADNGSGITPEAQRRLFEPLFTTKNDIGTGLGLWVSKQIVEKHGGTVRLRSRCEGRHRGTVIMIFLPESTD